MSSSSKVDNEEGGLDWAGLGWAGHQTTRHWTEDRGQVSLSGASLLTLINVEMTSWLLNINQYSGLAWDMIREIMPTLSVCLIL